MNFDLMKEMTEMLESADVSELPTVKARMFVRDYLIMEYGVNIGVAAQAATSMGLYFGATSVTEDEMEIICDMLKAFVKVAVETAELLVNERANPTFDDVLIAVMRQMKAEF